MGRGDGVVIAARCEGAIAGGMGMRYHSYKRARPEYKSALEDCLGAAEEMCLKKG